MKKRLFQMLCLIPILGIHMIILLKELDWYMKYRKVINTWYILSSLIVIILFLYFNEIYTNIKSLGLFK